MRPCCKQDRTGPWLQNTWQIGVRGCVMGSFNHSVFFPYLVRNGLQYLGKELVLYGKLSVIRIKSMVNSSHPIQRHIPISLFPQGRVLKNLNARQSENVIEFLLNPFSFFLSLFRVIKRSGKQEWLRSWAVVVSWPWSSNLVYNERPQWAITNKATLYRIILSLEKTPPFFPLFFLRGGGVFTQAICEIADVNRVPVYNCINYFCLFFLRQLKRCWQITLLSNFTTHDRHTEAGVPTPPDVCTQASRKIIRDVYAEIQI